MNEYKINISGLDPFGLGFLKHVVALANKGATICEKMSYTCKFPQSVTMDLVTEEEIETDMVNGIRVYVVALDYTKEQLEDMPWEDFKAVVKRRFQITGRDRQLMTTRYLQMLAELNKLE